MKKLKAAARRERTARTINYAMLRMARKVGFAVRHPVLWWWCVRMDLHCALGLPRPPPLVVRFPM